MLHSLSWMYNWASLLSDDALFSLYLQLSFYGEWWWFVHWGFTFEAPCDVMLVFFILDLQLYIPLPWFWCISLWIYSWAFLLRDDTLLTIDLLFSLPVNYCWSASLFINSWDSSWKSSAVFPSGSAVESECEVMLINVAMDATGQPPWGNFDLFHCGPTVMCSCFVVLHTSPWIYCWASLSSDADLYPFGSTEECSC